MMRRIAAKVHWALSLALLLLAAPVGAQVQAGRSVIDDLLTRAQNSYNDLEFARAETFARQVLTMPQLQLHQRIRALAVIAAAAYPDDPAAQRRQAAVDALKSIVRIDLAFTMPQELRWPGLNALVDEVKRTTFGMQASADTAQTVIGNDGRASLSIRSSRPGRFMLTIMQPGSPAVVVDSAASGVNNVAVFRIPAMRGGQPLFASGQYDVIVTGIDGAAPDTVTSRYLLNVEAPPLQLAALDLKVDSTKLLKERTGRFGFKSIFPAIIVGGATFALSNTLRAESENITTEVAADSKGMAIGGALAVATIVAGFADRGRPIPANIAANKAYGEAVEKAIADARAENARRLAEYRTILRFNLEAR